MANKQESLIQTSVENGIQKITLNRPKKKNALTGEMYKRLINIVNESANNETVNVLVITGNGDFYSSGNDFMGIFENEDVDINDELAVVENFVKSLIMYPKLLIAILNGPAIGITATTLALFDIVYAVENAYILTPFCKLGLSPEGCSTYTFPRILGPSKASELLFFGEKLSAHEAQKFGLVSRVYKTDAVNEVWTHIKKISTLSKQSMASTKRLLNRWNQKLLLEVNKQEIIELGNIYGDPNFMEHIIKFMANRNKM